MVKDNLNWRYLTKSKRSMVDYSIKWIPFIERPLDSGCRKNLTTISWKGLNRRPSKKAIEKKFLPQSHFMAHNCDQKYAVGGFFLNLKSPFCQLNRQTSGACTFESTIFFDRLIFLFDNISNLWRKRLLQQYRRISLNTLSSSVSKLGQNIVTPLGVHIYL